MYLRLGREAELVARGRLVGQSTPPLGFTVRVLSAGLEGSASQVHFVRSPPFLLMNAPAGLFELSCQRTDA